MTGKTERVKARSARQEGSKLVALVEENSTEPLESPFEKLADPLG